MSNPIEWIKDWFTSKGWVPREFQMDAWTEYFKGQNGLIYVSTGFGTDSPLMRLSTRIRPGGFGIPADQGAVPLIRLVTEETVDAPNGAYFDQLKANGRTRSAADDIELASGLWEKSAELVGL